jgi:hypothetical protein
MAKSFIVGVGIQYNLPFSTPDICEIMTLIQGANNATTNT